MQLNILGKMEEVSEETFVYLLCKFRVMHKATQLNKWRNFISQAVMRMPNTDIGSMQVWIGDITDMGLVEIAVKPSAVARLYVMAKRYGAFSVQLSREVI